MAFSSVFALRSWIFLFISLYCIFPFAAVVSGHAFDCSKADLTGDPPLAADCLYILDQLPGLQPFDSDTSFLQTHATNPAKPLSLKMSLRPGPLPTNGALINHGTCQLQITLHSFKGAARGWPEHRITQQQAHYYYYPEVRILGKELVGECVVTKKQVGRAHKGYRFPGHVEAAIYLKISGVEDPVVRNHRHLRVFDV